MVRKEILDVAKGIIKFPEKCCICMTVEPENTYTLRDKFLLRDNYTLDKTIDVPICSACRKKLPFFNKKSKIGDFRILKLKTTDKETTEMAVLIVNDSLDEKHLYTNVASVDDCVCCYLPVFKNQEYNEEFLKFNKLKLHD